MIVCIRARAQCSVHNRLFVQCKTCYFIDIHTAHGTWVYVGKLLHNRSQMKKSKIPDQNILTVFGRAIHIL